MNLWPCTSRALFSANNQRTTSRTDPHTHDPHFSQPSPAVLPARSADRRGRARQSQIHGFLMQKWKQACSCHLNVSPSRKRPESVTHDRQGCRSNVGTPGSAVGTLLGPTPALILLLAQCSNTCQRCCWHTVRTHVRLRAEASQENRAILSKFERFWTSSWQNVAPKTSSTCSNASWACC